MIFDLHSHTRNSYDGYTTADELLLACKVRGINAIAITEHDEVSLIDPAPFIESGIELIPGCEFTNEVGAHIIGLFVNKSIPFGQTTQEILNHIHSSGGLAIMPHPLKPGSGYLSLNCDLSLVRQFDFIELINGGCISRQDSHVIYKIATKFGVRMIASSDSHKFNQVGLCCISIDIDSTFSSAKQLLINTPQEKIELLVDHALLKKSGRRANIVQKSSLYQFILPLMPKKIRRLIKLAKYQMRRNHEPMMVNFQTVTIKDFQW